jgi:hypothetical protein
MDTPLYIIKPSSRKDKRYVVITNKGNMSHHFGSKAYDNYTDHGDDKRKKSYLARHKTRENWDKDGIHTSGFWSRWLLWNEKSLVKSARYIENRFGVRIVMKHGNLKGT